MEKQFIQVQLGLFFKNDFQGEVENVSLDIKKEFGSDITPQIIGIPQNAPSEIPRLVVNSTLVNINLAKNRIDFFSTKENFIKDNFEKVFNLIKNLNVDIGRVGVVITYFKEATIEEFKLIFNSSKIDSLNPKEITVRFNEEITLSGVKVNNSQMYTTEFLKNKEGIDKKGMIINRDINTLAEDTTKNSFNKKEILENFINEATKKAETILSF